MADQYSILVTYKCNWNCDYCITETHESQKKSPIRDIDLMEKVDSIPPGEQTSLSGGEPGLLSKTILKEVISRLEAKNCPIDLLTNGLFIKEHPEFLNHFENVQYHCVENIENEIEFPDLDQKKYEYVLILTNKNIDQAGKFIEKYPHIIFRVSANFHRNQRLDRTKGFQFIQKYKNRITVDGLMSIFENRCTVKVI